MKLTKYLLALGLYAAGISSPVLAGAPVWKIEKNGAQLFIGGTVHFLTATDYPLPKAFETAYQLSDKIVLETNLSAMQAPEFGQTMLQKMAYPEGQNLQLVLRPQTYQALESYCRNRSIPIATLLPFKPGMVSMILTITELQRLGFVSEGVDAFYNKKALQDNKIIDQLETVEQQLAFISSMGQGQEDAVINYTLEELKTLPAMMQSIVSAWREGDLDRLKKVAADKFEQDFPEIHQQLLLKRNNAWMPKIEAMFNTDAIEFVLVGSSHLVGEHGLIAKLSARGYQIQQIEQ
ncbi:MAG: hypothetical protein ACI9KN_001319 [Gammaproteobacteria bacterium]|jgi:uncharacterized protein YbaP (TraB family)